MYTICSFPSVAHLTRTDMLHFIVYQMKMFNEQTFITSIVLVLFKVKFGFVHICFFPNFCPSNVGPKPFYFTIGLITE